MMNAVKILVMNSLRGFHRCFHMSISRPSSPGAVELFMALRDHWISSSVMGCHGSSRGVWVN